MDMDSQNSIVPYYIPLAADHVSIKAPIRASIELPIQHFRPIMILAYGRENVAQNGTLATALMKNSTPGSFAADHTSWNQPSRRRYNIVMFAVKSEWWGKAGGWFVVCPVDHHSL